MIIIIPKSIDFCSINPVTIQEVTYMESDHAALITLRFLKIYATLPDLADNSLTRTSTDIVKELPSCLQMKKLKH